MIPTTATPHDLALALTRQEGGAIPATCTIAELAQMLGISERWAASQKATGRLPVLPESGKLDLFELIRVGVDAIGRRAGAPGLSLDLAHQLGLATGARVGAHCAQRAIAGDSPAAVQAAERALHDALVALGVAEPEQAEPTPKQRRPPSADHGKSKVNQRL